MLKKLRLLVFITAFALFAIKNVADAAGRDADDTTGGIFQSLQSQYNDLSPRGKMVTGAAVGFVGSRLALGTVTKVVKWGAGAFIVAEALKMTGIMDDIPSLSEEQNNMLLMVKGRVLQTTEDFRVKIRETLTQEKVQDFFDKERMCAFGVAGGVVAGAIL